MGKNRRRLKKRRRRRLRRSALSRPEEPRAQLSRPQPEANQLPTWRDLRQRINAFANQKGEWAGYPIPLDDLSLVVEPTHPLYKTLDGFRLTEDPGPSKDITDAVSRAFDCDNIHVRNLWVRSDGKQVVIWHNGDGRSKAALLPARFHQERRIHFCLNTILGCLAFNYEAELAAVQKLASLVNRDRWERYVLAGCLAETSQRSGLTYFFRKGRPTLVLRIGKEGTLNRAICALCLHPIGYYEDSFAGVMVPTDEVIAHLLLMRGDEAYYWRKANQHSIDSVECGL